MRDDEIAPQSENKPQGWFRRVVHSLLPNAGYDVFKFSIKTIFLLLAGSFLNTGILSGFLLTLTTVSLDWLIVVGLFVCSFLMLSIAFILGKVNKLREQLPVAVETAEPTKEATKSSLTLTAVGVVLLIIILLVGVAIGRTTNGRTAFFSQSPLTEIRHRNFLNESVLMDGKSYENCSFMNVTFIYNGTARFGFRNNVLSGQITVRTDNDAVFATGVLFKGLDLVRPEFQLVGPNLEPLPNVEPMKRVVEPMPSPQKQ